MRFWEWFRPGIRIKRYFLLGASGIGCISTGISFMLKEIYLSFLERVLSTFLILSGIVIIVISVKYIIKTIMNAITGSGFKISLDSDRLSSLLFEKRILIKGPKIVTIGGGTGLSTMLRGLKKYSSNITAIVTVADDGGGSGALRQDLGILPPGDIRNCILALADTEPLMHKLLQYRFAEGVLKGQSFGNLFLAAMDGISTNFEEAVRHMSEVLAVTGRVYPVTLQDMALCCELEDGYKICGESKIGHHDDFHPGRIIRAYLDPAHAEPLPEVIEAIKEADLIILGPGSLYTSVIPNLLVDGVPDAIKESKAIKAYVCNVMTQPGETEGYTVSDHVKAIEAHSYPGILDYCLINVDTAPEELLHRYSQDRAELVKNDVEELIKNGINIIGGQFVAVNNGLVRHDADKLARALIELVAEEVLAKDKKRTIDYYYVKDRLTDMDKLK